jgi:hypothetical protein
MVAQGLGGAAKGMAESRSVDKEIDALMERDRLNLASKEISGLEEMDLKVVLPSVGTFMERPEWEMPEAGLIAEWQKGGPNAKAATIK